MSQSAVKNWDGNEWEAYVRQLCRMRHGFANYVDVPDKHSGDFGIECYSLDGIAYQSYAPQEPLETKQLHEKLVAKITSDIKKFIDNAADLKALLGTTKISRWILVTPRHESAKTVAHCSKKSKEVTEKKLSFVADPFAVLINSEVDFAAEMQMIVSKGRQKMTIPRGKNVFSDWSKSNDILIGALDTKLKKVQSGLTGSQLVEMREWFVREYIEGQNLLDGLRANYPEAYEAADRIKRDRERYLAVETQLSTNPPSITLEQERNALRGKLTDAIAFLTDEDANTLTYEAIADWLLRCPLDFK